MTACGPAAAPAAMSGGVGPNPSLRQMWATCRSAMLAMVRMEPPGSAVGVSNDYSIFAALIARIDTERAAWDTLCVGRAEVVSPPLTIPPGHRRTHLRFWRVGGGRTPAGAYKTRVGQPSETTRVGCP